MAKEKTESGYKSVEEMQALRQTPAAIYSGACFTKGWRAGKMVTETEYDEAVKEFGNAPMGGKAAEKGGKINAS